jgi:hypothetical protein
MIITLFLKGLVPLIYFLSIYFFLNEQGKMVTMKDPFRSLKKRERVGDPISNEKEVNSSTTCPK